MATYRRSSGLGTFYAPIASRLRTCTSICGTFQVSTTSRSRILCTPGRVTTRPLMVSSRMRGSPRYYRVGTLGILPRSDMRAAYYGGTALTGAGQNLGLLEFLGYRSG